jgi:sugar phosphate isomerase/epimerase
MNRRDFITNATIVSGICLSSPALFAGNLQRDAMSRIGMSTTVFRDRFPSTNKGVVTDPMTLEEVPQYFSGRFNIRNIELWTPHFDSIEKSYLKKIKKALSRNRCTLINIQVDTPGLDISSPDKEIRDKGIELLKNWIDVGEFLGTKMLRMSGMRKEFDHAVASVRQLTAYAKDRNITILVENHGDMFVNPELHVQMAKEMVSSDNFGLLADFGNYQEQTDRFAALKLIAPYTKLVSAKTKLFDKDYNHISYDFDACVEVMESNGYKGIYSLEQYAPKGNYEFDTAEYDYEKIADWMVEHIKTKI